MAQHTKRIASPRSWPVKRKEHTWISSPKSGHTLKNSLPLNTVFKDLLKLAKTTKESRYIIFNKDVKLNGNKVSSEKAGMGIFDVLTLGEIKESYTLLLNTRGKLTIKKLSDKESEIILSKVVGKTYLPNKKIQLNFLGGMNLIVTKDECSIGDTAVISFKDAKIKEIIKLEKGALVYLLTGKNISKTAKVQEVQGKILVCGHGDLSFKINKDDIVTVGKDKPYISIE